MQLTKSHSLYLDLFRLIAATLVMLEHISIVRFSGGMIGFFHSYGHDAVVIFFVLSGYVITYVSDTKEKSAGNYLLSRFSRLYSVILPALILTIVLDTIGSRIDPTLYAGKLQSNHPEYRFLINLFNVQQVWYLNIKPFTNGPFWSMSYEFWYYVIFAAFVYTRSYIRIIVPLVLLFLVGPKIVVLFPLWLSGVLVYRLHKNNVRIPYPLFVFLITPVLFLALKLNLYETLPRYKVLAFSGQFIQDYITGLLVFLHLLASKQIFTSNSSESLIERRAVSTVIRFLAGKSFTMYLCHVPLFFFWAAVYNHDANNVFHIARLFFTTLMCIILIASFTENKKHVVRRWVINLISVTKTLLGMNKSRKSL